MPRVTLTEEIALDVVWRAISIDRRRQLTRNRPYEIGRHDDDQLGLVALELCRAEQRAEHRDVAEERRLLDVVRVAVLKQAGDHERLAGTELNRCFRAARRQRRDREAVERDASPRR